MQLPTLDTVLLGNKFVGIELFSIRGEEGIAIATVEKRKNELVISSKESRSNYTQILEKPKKEYPVFLVVNNANIIQKEFEGTDVSDVKVLNKAFPSIKIDDFYYEIWRLETQSIVAICRKSYIEEIISAYNQLGVTFAGVSLGVCSISAIKGFFKTTVVTNSQTVSFDSSPLLSNDVTKLVQTYDVNGLDVHSSYILAFSASLQKIITNNSTTGTIKEFNDGLYYTFYQKSFFTKVSRFMVFILLGLLLINFFIFNHYFKKANESTANLNSNKEMIDKIKTIKFRLKDKENKLKNATNVFDSKSSFYINELVKEVPSSVLLDEFTYHPLEKKIKPDEQIAIISSTIVISGKTNNTTDFTNWVEALGNYSWLKKVTIVHFGKSETGETIFTLKLEPHAVR